MSLTDLASIASLISSGAVFVSLIYLALQIRQTARNQRSLIDRGRSEQVGNWLQFIASPEIAPLVIRGHACDPTLTVDEQQRYVWCLYPLFLHYEDSFNQHREGMLGDAQYISICNQMKDSSSRPGVRKTWSEVRTRFAPEFQAFFDDIVRSATPPAPVKSAS